MQKRIIKSTQKMLTILLTLIITISMAPLASAATPSSADKLNSIGLLSNVTSDELKATLTRDIGLTMILKALGYEDDEALTYQSQSPFTDTEGWAKGWASLAYHLNITAGTSETTFTPHNVLSEREFLTFLLRAIGYDQDQSYSNTLGLAKNAGLITASHTMKSSNYTKEDAANAMYNALSASVQGQDVPLVNLLIKKGLFTMNQAVDLGLKDDLFEILTTAVINPHEIQVTFSQAVDPNKFFFDIETIKGGYRTLAIWDDLNTVATLVLASDLDPGTYTVTANEIFNGITKYSKTITVNDYSDLTLDIISSAVSLENNASIAYSLKNSYGEIIYNLSDKVTASAMNKTSNKTLTTIVVENNHDYSIQLVDIVSQGGKLGDEIEVTLTYNNIESKKVLTCVDLGDIETMILYDPVSNNGRMEKNSYNQRLDYSALSKDGLVINLPKHASNQDGVLEQETIGDFVFTSSNSAIFDVDTMRVTDAGEIVFSIGNGVGATEITALNKKTNLTSTVNVVVYLEPVLTEVEIQELTTIVTAGDSVELEAIGYDQFGVVIDIGYVSGLTVVSSDTTVVPKYSVKLRDNVFTYKGISAGESELSLYTASGNLLFSTEVTIEEESLPQAIVNVNMQKYFEADYDATYSLSYDNIVVIDQYANTYNLSDTDQRIKITYDEDSDDVLNLKTASFADGSLTINAKELEGTGTYTFTLGDDEDTGFSVDVTTVDLEDITKYELTDVNDLPIGLANTETMELKGYLSDGELVVIDDSTIEVVTSSNESLVVATFDGNEVTVEGVEGGDGGSVTITAWVEGVAIATGSVTVVPDENEDDEEE